MTLIQGLLNLHEKVLETETMVLSVPGVQSTATAAPRTGTDQAPTKKVQSEHEEEEAGASSSKSSSDPDNKPNDQNDDEEGSEEEEEYDENVDDDDYE
ncbi:hypothetical protein BVRB_1g007460 [Beta vulgaris subsp. vulgaris]|nr:hypothetical protein BVRB_1g007460 [Beta vulgaris subsp. vulgaris]